MVVLSACLTSKAGKPLVARQFVEMSRIRIEGLLAAFPKLINTVNQHTYVETESVRYVYQPMEGLYLLLITNKSSNIMEDLETLRLLAKLVPEFCMEMDEEGVRQCAFDLILAFDEVLAMGHRETINLQQVKTALEMESHEEKLHNMIRQSKMNEAKEEAKRKALTIDSQKSAKNKMGLGGMGNAGSSISAAFSDEDPPRQYEPDVVRNEAPARAKAPPKGKGMQLGGKSKQSNDVLKAMELEDELMSSAPPPRSSGGGSASAAPKAKASSGESVTLAVEEKLLVKMSKDGSLESLEVRGELKMCVNSADSAFTRVQVTHNDNANMQFKTHPNIGRPMWQEDKVLSHKDQSKSFPVGNELGVLKWRLPAGTEKMLPISLSCWPSQSGSDVTVNLEYEKNGPLDVSNLRIIVPCPGEAEITDVGEGDARYVAKKDAVEWRVELVDATNSSGSLEFTVSNVDADAFFPITVSFACTSGTIAGLKISGVTDVRTGNSVTYAATTSLEVEEYTIQ
mmetsp:Transcript_70647/g.103545  ORF Transcript_70647/g.103545 Transcript_70647/m.103545 type:complete len:511 (+) Transcript_70647:72-1604(+)